MLPRDHGSDHAAERTLTQLELDRTVRRSPSDNGMQFICPLIEGGGAEGGVVQMSNDAGPLGALLRLLKLQVKGRQRPPPISPACFRSHHPPRPPLLYGAFDHWSPPSSSPRHRRRAWRPSLRTRVLLVLLCRYRHGEARFGLEAQNSNGQPYLFCKITAEISTFSKLLSRLWKMKRSQTSPQTHWRHKVLFCCTLQRQDQIPRFVPPTNSNLFISN